MKNCTRWTGLRHYGIIIAVLCSSCLTAQTLHIESFDSPTFPPGNWQQAGGNTSYVFQVNSGVSPNQNPHSGAGEVEFNSYSLSSGSSLLISPVVDWSHLGTDSAAISFWFYRDGTAYLDASYYDEGVQLLVNTSATDVGATQLAFIPRIDTLAPVADSTGWFKYTYYVPRTFNTTTNYFIFKFVSEDGENCFLDDVSWQSFETPCTGTPVAGTISSSSNPGCPSSSFTLTLSGSTVAGGISYQWQSSTDSITWNNIAGAISTSISDTLSTSTYYRAVVTCAGSGLSATTPGYLETLNPFYNCYCVPAASNCNSNDVISNVTFAGINNSSSCGNNGYTQYYDTALVYQTLTFPISVSVTNGGTENVAVWIDYDHSGTFDASEYVAVGSGTGGVTFSNNINVPANAVTGLTRMRVRDQYGFGNPLPSSGACQTISDGETEDYLVNILPAPICSDPPAAGIITGAGAVCPGDSLSLSLSGQTLGTAVQWQSSTDSVNFTDITGAVYSYYNTPPIDSTLFYRVAVKCSTTVYTPIVTTAINPPTLCYCVPAASNCNSNDIINNVTFAGINNSSSCGTDGYTQYPDTATLLKTLTYPISVSVDNGGTENVAVWIDYDHSGTFDASEYVAIGSGQGGVTFSNHINVPSTAVTGVTRMRVRDVYGSGNQFANTDACSTIFDGETEDYVVNILPAPICSDPPTAGVITGGGSICPLDSFALNLSGQTLGTAMQWQSSTDSINFTDIPGAVNTYYTTPPITDSVYYRVQISCSTTVYTPVIKISVKPGYLCYCSEPAIGGGTTCGDAYEINSIYIPGTSLFSLLQCNVTNGYTYTQFPDSGNYTAHLLAPGNYPIVAGATDNGGYMAGWIDFNHDGNFDASENIFLDVNTSGAYDTFSFAIPANALPGVTGMRIRSSSSTISASDACTNFYDGETEDYIVHISVAPTCTGRPSAGTLTSTSNPICPANAFTLSVQNSTIAGGLSYQWQSSADNATWSNIAGDTIISSTDSISATTYYRFIITCNSSGLSDTSSVYTEAINSFTNCYCIPQAYCGGGDDINNVTFAGINNSSTCSGTGYTHYNDTAQVQLTVTYPISVGVDDGGTENVYAWIDYNHNGIFEASEFTAIGSGEGGVTFTNNITIPSNALLGVTAIRVRDAYGFSPIGASDACTDVYDGETEDYLVNITAAPICTNPPVPGTISGNNSACSGDSVTLNLSGQTLGTLTQWQVSSDSITFTDIAGAITISYTTPPLTTVAYYRVKVTCADSTFTNIIKVSINPFYLCANCTVSSDCNLDDEITNVTFAGINNNSTCGNNGYTSYSLTATVQQSGTYPISVSVNDGGVENTFVWIDYNHDGVYEPSEFTAIGSGEGGVTFTNNVTIPANALTGLTSMRVRDAYGDTSPIDSADACTSVTYGETEDYLVNIQVSAQCTSTPVAGTVSGPTSAAPGDTVTFRTTGSSGALQWIYATGSATGPFVAIPGADSTVFKIQVPGPGNYWIAVVASNPGCSPDTSNIIHAVASAFGDNVCSALPLTIGVNGPYTTIGATVQTGEPYAPAGSCTGQNTWCSASLQNTLWFTFVAPASGRVSINTVSFDTKIAVWSAATCDTILHGGAVLLAANDNDADAVAHGIFSTASYIDSITCLTAGKTYYVQVLPASGTGDTTSIMLRDLGTGPNPAFALAPHFCLPATSVTLTSANGGAVFGGPGVTGNVFNPNTAGVGGPFVITDTVWGCYVARDTVRISRTPQLTLVKNADVACYGDNTGNVSVTAVNGTPVYSYSWNNGGNTDTVHVTAGSYYVTVTDAAGCVAYSDTVTVTQPATLLTVSTSITDQQPGTNSGAVNQTVNGGTTPYVYGWSNGATTQNLGNLAAGVYTSTVTDNSGCSIITSDTVKLSVGIEVLEGGLTLNIFPNPTQSHVYIDLDMTKADDVTLQVYDVNGRLIKYDEQKSTTKAMFDVNLSEEASGIYLARIKAGDTMITRRIVLTR